MYKMHASKTFRFPIFSESHRILTKMFFERYRDHIDINTYELRIMFSDSNEIFVDYFSNDRAEKGLIFRNINVREIRCDNHFVTVSFNEHIDIANISQI